MQLEHFLTWYTKAKWIKDLNVRWGNIKLLGENRDSTFFDIGLCNIFLDLSPQARKTKVKINKWDLIELKKLLDSEGNCQQNEKTIYWMGEDICIWCV